MSAPNPDLTWTAEGAPSSARFGDVYFSREGGLAEARAVFLQGCGLPHAWSGRTRFTVAELGFGTGLNIVALLTLWQATRPPGARLHVFSVEAHPIAAADAGRALGAFPEVAEAAALLTRRWPGVACGFHRVDLPEMAASLDVAVMDAAEALAAWSGPADAWFLDGFAPARNPGMWTQAVLELVAARSAPGARAATYTVAGAVRRGLEAAGLAVERRPGFGRKRERLEAQAPGAARAERPVPRVAIVGAGIAGASLARAFAAEGVAAQVFDPGGAGAGASGNPAALVTPRLDAGLGPPARLFAQAFARATALYAATPGAVIARGALQLRTAERDERRFAAIAASDIFEPGALRVLEPAQAAKRLGEPAPGGLEIAGGQVIAPAPVLAAWAPPVRRAEVAGLRRADGAWRLLGADGETLAEADVVCLACGTASGRLGAPFARLPLQAVRGQANWTATPQRPPAAAFGAYVIPTLDGVLFGATHDRDQEALDVRTADTARNLAALGRTLPALAARLATAPLQARAAVRAATPDRLPLAGAVGEDGLFVLAGLGSRGFTLAPLLAEHVAGEALGVPSPLPAPLAALVRPGRFAR